MSIRETLKLIYHSCVVLGNYQFSCYQIQLLQKFKKLAHVDNRKFFQFFIITLDQYSHSSISKREAFTYNVLYRLAHTACMLFNPKISRSVQRQDCFATKFWFGNMNMKPKSTVRINQRSSDTLWDLTCRPLWRGTSDLASSFAIQYSSIFITTLPLNRVNFK